MKKTSKLDLPSPSKFDTSANYWGSKSPHLGGFRGAIRGISGGRLGWGQDVFRRTINLFKSSTSFLTSTVTCHPIIYGMPPAIGVELTNHCNLHCPECPAGAGTMSRRKGFMEPELFGRIINELKPYLWNVNLYFQGEPMLHPVFFDFLKIAEPLHTTVSTNGHFITVENAEKLALSGLNKLIISLDGLDLETYSKYRRNGDIERVKEGIKNAADARIKIRSKMKVSIQMLVNRYNENQVAGMAEFARRSSVSLALKSMQIYEGSSFSEWVPENNKYGRYELRKGIYKVKSSLPRRCARLWFNPVITWDGKVLPCCFDKDADHVMGDLMHESFREIWHGKKFRQFRHSVLHGREKIPICMNCTSGLSGVKL